MYQLFIVSLHSDMTHVAETLPHVRQSLNYPRLSISWMLMGIINHCIDFVKPEKCSPRTLREVYEAPNYDNDTPCHLQILHQIMLHLGYKQCIRVIYIPNYSSHCTFDSVVVKYSCKYGKFWPPINYNTPRWNGLECEVPEIVYSGICNQEAGAMQIGSNDFLEIAPQCGDTITWFYQPFIHRLMCTCTLYSISK